MLISIWCEDINRGIAKNNKLPWTIKSEMISFKNFTTNHIVLMGYNTFKSLDFKPLKNRINYVLTNKMFPINHNVTLINSINDIDINKNIVFCIGGKYTYDLCINKSDFLFVSKLFNAYDCDLFMDNDYQNFNLINILHYDEFDLYIYQNKNINKQIDVFSLFNFSNGYIIKK